MNWKKNLLEEVLSKHNLDCNKYILANNKLIFKTNKSMLIDNKHFSEQINLLLQATNLFTHPKLVKAK